MACLGGEVSAAEEGAVHGVVGVGGADGGIVVTVFVGGIG